MSGEVISVFRILCPFNEEFIILDPPHNQIPDGVLIILYQIPLISLRDGSSINHFSMKLL